MKEVKWFKLFALGLGGILGLSHIGLIGIATRKASVPIISPPVGLIPHMLFLQIKKDIS